MVLGIVCVWVTRELPIWNDSTRPTSSLGRTAGTLTAALATTYVGSVLLLHLVLRPLAADSALSVAGSTVAVGALLRPARTRILLLVDHQFCQGNDAARTLYEYPHRLRHDLDLDAVGAGLCAAADQTVQPSDIALWLRP